MRQWVQSPPRETRERCSLGAVDVGLRLLTHAHARPPISVARTPKTLPAYALPEGPLKPGASIDAPLINSDSSKMQSTLACDGRCHCGLLSGQVPSY